MEREEKEKERIKKKKKKERRREGRKNSYVVVLMDVFAYRCKLYYKYGRRSIYESFDIVILRAWRLEKLIRRYIFMSDVSIGIGETGYYNDTKIRSNVLDQVNDIDFYDLETAKEKHHEFSNISGVVFLLCLHELESTKEKPS